MGSGQLNGSYPPEFAHKSWIETQKTSLGTAILATLSGAEADISGDKAPYRPKIGLEIVAQE